MLPPFGAGSAVPDSVSITSFVSAPWRPEASFLSEGASTACAVQGALRAQAHGLLSAASICALCASCGQSKYQRPNCGPPPTYPEPYYWRLFVSTGRYPRTLRAWLREMQARCPHHKTHTVCCGAGFQPASGGGLGMASWNLARNLGFGQGAPKKPHWGAAIPEKARPQSPARRLRLAQWRRTQRGRRS